MANLWSNSSDVLVAHMDMNARLTLHRAASAGARKSASPGAQYAGKIDSKLSGTKRSTMNLKSSQMV